MATQSESYELRPQATSAHVSTAEPPPDDQSLPRRCSEPSAAQALPSRHGVLHGILGIVAKHSSIILGALSFIIACVGFWPATTATSDGHHAELLAEWTARKDFLETCEHRNWTGADCEMSRGEEIGAPPNFYGTDWKRHANRVPETEADFWTCIFYSVYTYAFVRL
ncbi:hypothetical protein F5Y13DRAFT_174377 [Hypoxylon sp. FL1857]|nr:hypothetical protein F5Y13DRAFT_174377 [Hypoxylon sp. FL1857]